MDFSTAALFKNISRGDSSSRKNIKKSPRVLSGFSLKNSLEFLRDFSQALVNGDSAVLLFTFGLEEPCPQCRGKSCDEIVRSQWTSSHKRKLLIGVLNYLAVFKVEFLHFSYLFILLELDYPWAVMSCNLLVVQPVST